MLQEEDIVLGTKVRCLQYGTEFGKIGTIKDIIGKFFYVYDKNGDQVGQGWTNVDSERRYFDLEDDATLSRSHPMDHSDRKVGTKVICVYTDNLATGLGHLYGMVGTISRMGGGLYHVITSNGEAIGDEGWSENSSFNVIAVPTTTRPMLAGDKIIGTRVICVFEGAGTFGRIGTISNVDFSGSYTVTDDDGNSVGGAAWNHMSSFEVIVNSPIQSKETVGDIVVDSVTASPVKSGPCPAYYYGIRACTCGKCSIGSALRFH